MRKASTAISELKIRGVTRYRVTYPTATGRKRELYVDRKKAEKRLKEVKDEQKRFGQSVTAMTSTTRAEATAAEKLLADSGITLVEAARFILAEKKREQSGVPCRFHVPVVRRGSRQLEITISDFKLGRSKGFGKYQGTRHPRERVVKFCPGRYFPHSKKRECDFFFVIVGKASQFAAA